MNSLKNIFLILSTFLSLSLSAVDEKMKKKSGETFLKSIAGLNTLDKNLVTLSGDGRSFIYDDALIVLWLVQKGEQERAGQILKTLADHQRVDGGISFSLLAGSAPQESYVRSGALAWVGYAAAQYLNTAKGGKNRNEIVEMAHRISSFLLERQVKGDRDPRRGLITGGTGTYSYQVVGKQLKEIFSPQEVTWVATEHNIDAVFFLHEFAKVTKNAQLGESARQIEKALTERVWNPTQGLFFQGMKPDGPDSALALDCAAWGGLFWLAKGDRKQAEAAFVSAETRFKARDETTGIQGHRPYVDRALVESAELKKFLGVKPGKDRWEEINGVWPEGGAAVALLAYRLGHSDRAQAILSELEKLRDPSGALPDFSQKVPNEFERANALAGTSWFALVQAEIKRGKDQQWLWAGF
jgi:hypothetical protein